ncbi:MAG: PIN domain-containing protein [Cyanobacteriota bacterium]
MEYAIWTEDQDFFGISVATWTTATVGSWRMRGKAMGQR